jgi:hypothetical protein
LAQVDTSAPPATPPATVEKGPDSTVPSKPVVHVRHDSAHFHHDSTRVVKAVKKDTALVVKRDTTSGGVVAVRDTTAAVKTGVPPAAPPVVRQEEGFIDRAILKKVLASNFFFNFSGHPVVEIFEVHRATSKDSLFYLLVFILFYFALIRIFFEKYFNNLMTLFFRVSLRQQQIREQVLQTPLPSLLLNILFIITTGLFACYLLHYSRFGMGLNFWILYLDCMGLLTLIYLGKFVVLKFCGWVFNISRGTDTYIFVVFLVNKMLGIFLLPFLILITFSGETAREIFITISLSMVFLLLMYRVTAAYRPVRNEIKLTPFHFFLYLCAFEIAPLLLIYKVLLSYLIKVY